MPLHANCAISVPNNSTRLYPKTVPPYPTIVPNRTPKPYDRTTPYHKTLPLYHTVSQSRTSKLYKLVSFRRVGTVRVLVHSKRYIDIWYMSLFGYGYGVRFWGTVFGYGFSGYGFRGTVLGYGFGYTVFGVRFWSTVLRYGTVQWYGRVLSIGTLPTLRKNTSFFWYIQ